MISIVVCSRNGKQFRTFTESVAATIGVEHEVVQIDNSNNKYNICQAYNEGVRLSKYEIICFSHEDIVFHTQDWGKVLIRVLNDHQIGLVGVFGICFFTLYPAVLLDPNEFEGQVIIGTGEGYSTNHHNRFSPSPIAEVAGVDGLFMTTRRSVMKQYSFPENELKGFHGYDMDINMQIRQQYKIVVTHDILMYHESGGNFNESYFETLNLLAKKWKSRCPVYVPGYSAKELEKLNLKVLEVYYNGTLRKNPSLSNYMVAFRYASKQRVLLPWLRSMLSKKNSRKTSKSNLLAEAK